jgi:hypothetical protein
MASFLHQSPGGGVTEIRVHGVGGTSPVAMLGRSDLVQVAGDEISGFYRSTEQGGSRTVEAYSWGGLTASSASRALWVLLLPFSLVNIAGWMIEPERERQVTPAPGLFGRINTGIAAWGRRNLGRFIRPLRGIQEWLVHLLALALTATYVQLTAFVSVDLLALQCGGDPGCRERLPLAQILGEANHVGRRLVIGMAVPLLLVLLFLYLARNSRLSYESFRPQDKTIRATRVTPLEDPLIWDRVRYQKVMAQLHGVASAGVLMATLSGTALQLTGPGQWEQFIFYAAGFTGVALFAIAFVLIGLIAARRDRPASEDDEKNAYALWERIGFYGLLGSLVLLGVTMAIAWRLRDGVSPDLGTWFGTAPWALLIFALVVGFSIAGLQAIRWVAEGYLHIDQFLVPLLALVVAVFPRAPVFVAVAIVIVGLDLWASWREGRRVALWDLVILASPAVIGLVLGAALGEAAFAWAGVGIATVTAAFLWLARRPEPGFRWAGTGAVGAFAAVILLGVFSGGIVRIAEWLSDDDTTITYPEFYQWAVVAVTVALVVMTLAHLLFWARITVLHGASWKEEAEKRLTEAKYTEDAVAAIAKSTSLMRGVTEATRAVDVMITMVGMVVFAAFLSRAGANSWGEGSWDDWYEAEEAAWAWLLDLSGWLSLLAVLGAYLAVRSGLRSETTRRKIGMVWDVASFFPRSFHPLAPPAYAARAIPEIQARVREAVKDGGKVILTGHSQGSVIVTAVLASLPESITKQTALVTYGSPIGRFYRPFFPAALPEELITKLVGKVGPSQQGPDTLYWLNFFRPTDFIADPAFRSGETGNRMPPAPVEVMLRSRGRQALGGDVVLDDPWEPTLVPYKPLPRIRGHSGYESDPAWAASVEALAGSI